MVELKNRILGLTLKEADKVVETEDYYIRVVSVDGRPMIITRDYRLDRINVYIQEDVIVKADFG